MRIKHRIKVIIGKLRTTIDVAIVDANIPLLIRLDYQKEWGVVMDVQLGTLKIKCTRETFKVNTSRDNHWKLKIQNKSIIDDATDLVLYAKFVNMEQNDLRKHIRKVHRNLGHKSVKQLNLLFRMAKQTGPYITVTLQEVIEGIRDIRRRLQDQGSRWLRQIQQTR